MTDQQTITHESQTPQFGVLIGATIVIALAVFGGLFFWGKSVTPADQLDVVDVRPTFEVMTSHVDEPNLSDSELPPIK
jgi:hypothetical protein